MQLCGEKQHLIVVVMEEGHCLLNVKWSGEKVEAVRGWATSREVKATILTE
jgi:hypothetical protein